jgi:hypothetical protein
VPFAIHAKDKKNSPPKASQKTASAVQKDPWGFSKPSGVGYGKIFYGNEPYGMAKGSAIR